VSVDIHPARATPARAARPPSAAASLGAVVRRGLRDHRRAPLTWGGSLGAMSGLMAAMWPSIDDSIGRLLQSYPQGLKDAFNIREINSVETYVDAEMLTLILPVALAFLGVRCATGAISMAEERGHLDTLLAAPLSRRTLVAGSFTVAALAVAGVLTVITSIAWVAGTLAGADPSLVVLGRGMANVWPLSMFFTGIAILAAGRLHGSAAVTATAGATLVAMYVIDLVGKLADPIEPLRRVSAFRYYGSAIQDGIDPAAFAGLSLAGAALAALGALLFERRDVR
jgi:ABC-2 type transport system permease protein